MAGEWRALYLEDTSLFETYTHSHRGTFIRTIINHDINIDKLTSKLKQISKSVIKDIKSHKETLMAYENMFLDKYNDPLKKKYTRESFIAKLDKDLKEGEAKDIYKEWGKLKMNIKKDSKAKKQDDPILEQQAVNYFKNQMSSIGATYNKYLDAYDTMVENAAETRGVNSGVYATSIENLRKFAGILLNPPSTRKELNTLFKQLIKSTIDLGWTIEPLTKIAIEKTLRASLVGEEYNTKKIKSVIDLEMQLGKIKFGINVKSQPEKYHIKRANDFERDIYTSPGLKNQLSYIRRNLGALKNYSFDWDSDEDAKKFNEYYKSFLEVERKLAFYTNLVSAIDGLEEDIHSILISFQGGFLWTTDVLNEIIKDIDNETKNVISYKAFKWTKNNTAQLKTLWNNKRKIMNASKKPGNPSLSYQLLSNAKPRFHKDSLIDHITYTINLAKAKGVNK